MRPSVNWRRGHGVLSLLAAEERPDIQIEGTDISPPAVAVANRLLAVSGHAGRVKFTVKDALNALTTAQVKVNARALYPECLPNTCLIRCRFSGRFLVRSHKTDLCSLAQPSSRRSEIMFLNTTGKASLFLWPRLLACG